MRSAIDPNDKGLLADVATLNNIGEAVWKSLETEMNSMKKNSSLQK
jgi:hypothetical protein